MDGGAGSDTLRFQSTAANVATADIAATTATISNMEVFEAQANDGANDTTFTVDMDAIDGVTSIVLDANDVNAANTFNLNDLSAAQAGAITVQGAVGATNGADVELDMKVGSGAADAASITASLTTGNTLTIGDANGNIESLTLQYQAELILVL